MNKSTFSLEALPNEILIDVLDVFSTKDLLGLASISHRFHQLILRLLHRRLLDVGALPANDIVFECYLPSKSISTPPLSVEYLQTQAKGEPIGESSSPPSSADLQRLYTSFRPVVSEENRRSNRRRRHPAPEASDAAEGSHEDEKSATEDIYLDDGELFSQLCAKSHVVKLGPRRGLYHSHVTFIDGVIRVWREWLADMITRTGSYRSLSHDDGHVLWVDIHKTVGVRFQVSPGAEDRMPLITGPDDFPPLHYKLQFEELYIQTTKLLLAVERSEIQEVSHSGKAVVIASM